jgi:hypothetical protein
VDAAVKCGAHCLMEHIQVFTWSHWMLPSGICCKKQNTNKKTTFS